ncbi:MAG: nucleotide pyrophosphohydrolase [Planctomycetaceae bacterium]|nr:nucleotide pyrophosphohydrolase [Planctomycetaceae bacterium]
MEDSTPAESSAEPLTLSSLQKMIAEMFGHKDAKRGVEGTFMWFMEEVGELAGALRAESQAELEGEFADVLAWLVTLANLRQVDLAAAIERKYCRGCPRCRQDVCQCHLSAKP